MLFNIYFHQICNVKYLFKSCRHTVVHRKRKHTRVYLFLLAIMLTIARVLININKMLIEQRFFIDGSVKMYCFEN